MADIFTKKKRSEIMSMVRNKDSKIEIKFRKALWKARLRYRKNSTKYFGKPDLIFKKRKIVIFIDSCFWHGCKKHGSMPKVRIKFWKAKLKRNKQRDKEVNRYYKKLDWKLFRIWEHDLKKNPAEIIVKIIDFMHRNTQAKFPSYKNKLPNRKKSSNALIRFLPVGGQVGKSPENSPPPIQPIKRIKTAGKSGFK